MQLINDNFDDMLDEVIRDEEICLNDKFTGKRKSKQQSIYQNDELLAKIEERIQKYRGICMEYIF